MTDNELLAVMDREAELLTADNWHASAAIMRAAADLVRRQTARVASLEAAQATGRTNYVPRTLAASPSTPPPHPKK